MPRSDIPNVNSGQYLDMYEVDGSNQIQAWHEYQLTSGDINSGLTHGGSGGAVPPFINTVSFV